MIAQLKALFIDQCKLMALCMRYSNKQCAKIKGLFERAPGVLYCQALVEDKFEWAKGGNGALLLTLPSLNLQGKPVKIQQ